ncbi:methyltetrahydrofolate--corrinoid methyltransferase [Desulfomonile tiedjei]|uniref:Pterin binding enzyme n=1 Tax=Desulfomonile tiedjei (strain ATCC 49306 / DSM 6799 / DCB-1) TaxID=706587 RepID=I4C5F4_DESTA|nr:methyltetrahydrofolate--corrinoid methyltransferase [Desulfomonile tiedjei]AFM24795.1 Pterin binding enzyme [Desulfomonile tiedjei DSM 6799]
MLIIGEKINSSIPSTANAIKARDEGFLTKLALDQMEAGAQMIDVNAGTFVDEEIDLLKWLIGLVQSVADIPLCIDSPNPVALAEAMPLSRKKSLVNSISLEAERYSGVVSVVKEHKASVVALCMDDKGIPKDAAGRIEIACRLADKLNSDGIANEDIYFDVLVQPISVDASFGMACLEAVIGIRNKIPGAHTTCGLSNISFGLPERKLLNSTYLTALMTAGMDTFIIDPLDKRMMATILASQAVLGQDEYCAEYLSGFRAGKLK